MNTERAAKSQLKVIISVLFGESDPLVQFGGIWGGMTLKPNHSGAGVLTGHFSKLTAAG